MTASSRPDKPKKQTPLERFEELGMTADGLGPWSHSKLKLLGKCPFQFYLKYILKHQPETPPSVSLITEVGKAAHLILEYVVKGKSIADSYKLAKKEFLGVITDEEWTEHVETLEGSIFSFKERIDRFDSANKVKRIHTEIRIGVDKNWQPTGFFADDVYFRGVIDLVLQLENGDVVYLDHKTGAVAAAGLRNYMDQLNTYKVLFHHGIEKTAGAQSGIHYIREGELKLGDYVDSNEIENVLKNRLECDIQNTIDGVKEIGYFKHIAGNSCKYCDYATECKGKKLKDLEKDSSKWFE